MTPSIVNAEGFRFAIYANDHLPPHAHAYKGGGEVRIVLHGPDGGVSLMSARGVTPQDQRRALAIAREHLGALWEGWRNLHG